MSDSNNARSNRRGGRVSKTNEGTASVAPEGTVAETAETAEVVTETGAKIEQPAEVAEAIVEEGASEEVPAEAPAPEVDVVDKMIDEATLSAPEVYVEPEQAAAPTDPFADLPMVKIEDYEFRDLSGAVAVSDPRKYEGVHKAATEAKAHMKPGWKHAADMIALGTNRRELKPGSVWGTIQSIVASYGRAGVPAYVLVAKVRQAQIGNKRSHYCTALPPIGWAEGWVDTFVSKKMGKVMEKKAPVITQEVVQEIQAGDAEASAKAAEIAKAA